MSLSFNIWVYSKCFCSCFYHLLTCAGKAITSVSWIADTTVTALRATGARIRCDASTSGVLVTGARYLGCTRRPVCGNFCITFYTYTFINDVNVRSSKQCRTICTFWHLDHLLRLNVMQNAKYTIIYGTSSQRQPFQSIYYRAMHFSAKRGIAIACRLSVRLSVRPSVTLVNCDHIGWNSSKIISRTVSLGCSLFATQTSRVYSKGNTLEFSPE